MTEPTQAQIEAVELAIAQAAYPDVHPDFTDAGWRRMAVAALTAAAEVGPMFECPKCGADLAAVDNPPHKCIAAAEVGRTGQEASDNATTALGELFQSPTM